MKPPGPVLGQVRGKLLAEGFVAKGERGVGGGAEVPLPEGLGVSRFSVAVVGGFSFSEEEPSSLSTSSSQLSATGLVAFLGFFDFEEDVSREVLMESLERLVESSSGLGAMVGYIGYIDGWQ